VKQQYLTDKAGTLRLTIYSDNIAVVPSSATVTIYKSDGSSLQAETAATVGATGEMTYALTATHTADTGLNFKAAWSYVVDGTTYYENQLFDVVKSILSIPVTDADLFNELDSLRKVAKQETGTATAGTTSTLVDTSKRKEDDNFWKGGTLEIISGTNAGQARTVTVFVQSTATLTVSPVFGSAIDTTSVYRIVRSFTNKIAQSFEKIEDALYNAGKRQDLILESSQIKFPLIYLTIHFIAIDLSDDKDDKWDRLAQEYWKKYQDAYTSLRLEYDTDESGNIEGGEEQGARPFELTVGRQ
jgi:hypothetical protein